MTVACGLCHLSMASCIVWAWSSSPLVLSHLTVLCVCLNQFYGMICHEMVMGPREATIFSPCRVFSL